VTDIYVTGIQFRGRGHARRRPDPTLPDTDMDQEERVLNEDRSRRCSAKQARVGGRFVAGTKAVARVQHEPWAALIWEEAL